MERLVHPLKARVHRAHPLKQGVRAPFKTMGARARLKQGARGPFKTAGARTL